MIEVDVTGTGEVIESIKVPLESLAVERVRIYRHGGISGESGVLGLVTTVATAALPSIVDLLKPLVSRDRNLKINVNGVEFAVRDIGEAGEVLDLLAERGLLRGGGGHGRDNV